MEQLRLNPTAPVELTETEQEALFAFRTELLDTEAGFYALFSGLELEEAVLLSVQRAIMSIPSVFDLVTASMTYYDAVFKMFNIYLQTEEIDAVSFAVIQRVLYTQSFVQYVQKVDFIYQLISTGSLTIDMTAEFTTIWSADFTQIQTLETISTTTLAGIGITFTVVTEFEFSSVVSFTTFRQNPFQACVMSFINSYVSDISSEGLATIERRIFEYGAFEIGRTQIQIREYFLSLFSETDADFIFIRNLVYSPRFTSLAFIFEILVQIESQIGTDFGYFSFNDVIGDFVAD